MKPRHDAVFVLAPAADERPAIRFACIGRAFKPNAVPASVRSTACGSRASGTSMAGRSARARAGCPGKTVPAVLQVFDLLLVQEFSQRGCGVKGDIMVEHAP